MLCSSPALLGSPSGATLARWDDDDSVLTLSEPSQADPIDDELSPEPPDGGDGGNDEDDDGGGGGDDGDGGGPVRWVTIATFWMPLEAHLARLRLEAEEIPCVMLDENLIATDWLYANAAGGIKLQVPEPDAARARACLPRRASHSVPEDLAPEDEDDPRDPGDPGDARNPREPIYASALAGSAEGAEEFDAQLQGSTSANPRRRPGGWRIAWLLIGLPLLLVAALSSTLAGVLIALVLIFAVLDIAGSGSDEG